MRFKEIKGLSPSELKEKEQILRREVMELRFDNAAGKLFNTASRRKKRKELARILTCLNLKI